MRKLVIVFVFCVLSPGVFNAWTNETPNMNTWLVSINGKNISSSADNQMSESVHVLLKQLKATDIIHAQRYLCGASGEGMSTLTLKDNLGTTLKQLNGKSTFVYEVDLPLKDVYDKLSAGQTLSVYFTISGAKNRKTETVLLCKIELN